jgi:hypothetical protein
MYNYASAEVLHTVTIVRDENYLLQRFCPFSAFEIIQNNVWQCTNARKEYKMYKGKSVMFAGTLKLNNY